MLRRMPERHKKLATALLQSEMKNAKGKWYDALYTMPHGDSDQGERPPWPTNDAIEEMNAMK